MPSLSASKKKGAADASSSSSQSQCGRPPKPVRQNTISSLLRRTQTSSFSFRGSNGEFLPHDDIELFDGRSTFSVVSGQIPDHLLEGLRREFTPGEVDMIFARIHKTLAPSVDRPGALFVLGPSGVGKSVFSTAQATLLFGSDNNAVIVDGAEFREVHAGYQAVAVHGMENKVLHADAWSIFRSVGAAKGSKEGISSKLKQRVLAEAIADRQHLIIPDCANNPTRLQEMVDKIAAQGYRLHAICLWAPLSVTKARGIPRSIRDGKLWSPDEYTLSVQGSLAMALRWDEGMKKQPDVYRSLHMWDNCHFPAEEVSLRSFIELTNYTAEQADDHVAKVTRTYNAHRLKLMKASGLAVAKLRRSAANTRATASGPPPAEKLKAADRWAEAAAAIKAGALTKAAAAPAAGGDIESGGGAAGSPAQIMQGLQGFKTPQPPQPLPVLGSSLARAPADTTPERRSRSNAPATSGSGLTSVMRRGSATVANGARAVARHVQFASSASGAVQPHLASQPTTYTRLEQIARLRHRREGAACGLLLGLSLGAGLGVLATYLAAVVPLQQR